MPNEQKIVTKKRKKEKNIFKKKHLHKKMKRTQTTPITMKKKRTKNF